MQMPQKDTVCCFTGHRIIDENKSAAVFEKLYLTVKFLADEGITTFISGGAIGFDTMAAKAVLKLRETNKNVQLIVIIPCRDQHKRWHPSNIRTYEEILAVCDEVICLNDRYCTGCMHQRNRIMVDLSSVCVAYFDGHSGGTAYTVNRAKDQGLRIINLAKTV